MHLRQYIVVIAIILMGWGFISAVSMGSKKQKENDLAVLHLKGKVKTMRSIMYLAYLDSGKLKRVEQPELTGDKLQSSFEESYNEMGYKTVERNLTNEGKITGTTILKYNKRNYLIEELNYNSSGNLINRISFRNDSAGNITAVIGYGPNRKPYVKDSNVYDSSGNVIEELEYSDGKLWSFHQFIYDKKGNRIEWDDYNRVENKFHTGLKFRYDDKGNEIEQDDDDQNSRIVMMYDEKGNEIVKTEYEKGCLYKVDSCKYDEENNLLERVSYSQGRTSFETKEIYKYDKEGNEIQDEYVYGPDALKTVITNGGSSILTKLTTYEYDKKGNWTKQVVHNKGQKKYYVTERTFTYY
jgi:hypothetical protein